MEDIAKGVLACLIMFGLMLIVGAMLGVVGGVAFMVASAIVP